MQKCCDALFTAGGNNISLKPGTPFHLPCSATFSSRVPCPHTFSKVCLLAVLNPELGSVACVLIDSLQQSGSNILGDVLFQLILFVFHLCVTISQVTQTMQEVLLPFLSQKNGGDWEEEPGIFLEWMCREQNIPRLAWVCLELNCEIAHWAIKDRTSQELSRTRSAWGTSFRNNGAERQF